MKKILFLLAIILISVCTLLFYKHIKNINTKNNNKNVTIILDWFINPNHAALFIAQEKGFFTKAGINLNIIAPSDPADGPKLVAANQADFAIDYQPSLMVQIDKGLPLIRIASIINQPLDCLVVLKNGPIKKIADLKNKTIGYSMSSFAHLMLFTMLKYNGLKLHNVHLINVHYDLSQALLAGRIDGFTGAMRNFETIQMELAGHPVRAFYPEKSGFPNYDELIIVANKNHLDKKMINKFLRALQKGVTYLKANPTECWQLFIIKHPELNDELNKRAWFLTLQYFANNPAILDKNKYENLTRFLYENKLLQKEPLLNDYAL